ncbi:hypothetical protein L3D22_14320 [Lysobacter soli]|uniref:hypothetical protein n=1 Tax=Lysobacter soli TaxID=453783 RepID=UPI00209C6E7B|nr:hypothetical protein [Lysobacter soli]UTA53520.1 hypothetical protein L3D22_14320 [Lysobacter soli]
MKTSFGTFGDSFGAVNALFSGLALAGVVLTLFFHSEGAKRAAKPFIVPRLQRGSEDARVTIGGPTREGAQVSLPLTLSVPLHNASANPALNVSVKLAIQNIGPTPVAVTEIPLSADSFSTCELTLKISGVEANRFVGAVCADGVIATLQVEYDSVEGVRWASLVKYMLRVNANRNEDAQMLRDAIDGAAGDNLWAAGATVDLVYELVPGSWGYKEV